VKSLNQVTSDDVKNIVSEMLLSRYTMHEVNKEKDYTIFFYFSKLCCCKNKSMKRLYEIGRVSQAKRKLEKVQNVIRIL
jgi:hypothetical protein